MKSKFKTLTLVAVGGCLLVISVTAASAQYNAKPGVPAAAKTAVVSTISTIKPVTVSDKKIAENTDLYNVEMTIPVISGMADKSYEMKLNEEIANKAMKQVEQLKQAAAEGAKSAKADGYEFNPYQLNAVYKVKSAGGSEDGGKLSIVIEMDKYFGGAHGSTNVYTYNVSNEKTAFPLTLKQALGSDDVQKANDAVRKAIKQHPEEFFPEFDSIEADQPFYIEKGKVVLVFSQGTIAPHPVGVVEIPVE